MGGDEAPAGFDDFLVQRRKGRSVDADAGGLLDVTDIADQLEILSRLPGVRVEFVDVTDSPDIPLEFKSAVKGPAASRTILVWEPFLAPGRLWKARIGSPPQAGTIEAALVGRNINVADAAQRRIATSIGNRFKRFASAKMSFWTTAARAAKSSVARDITLESVYNDGGGTTFSATLRSLAGNTNGDVWILGSPESYAWVGPKDEFRLSFSDPGAAVFVDAFVYAEAV